MPKLNMSAPWVTLYHQIVALFGDDPEIHAINYDEENNVIKMYVENSTKAEAIGLLLGTERTFGNVTVKIDIIPANPLESGDITRLFNEAFRGNPAFSYLATADGIFSNPITYVVFKNEVVQYWDDNLGDVNGNCSTLYQEIAKNVIDLGQNAAGVFYCTDVPDEE